MIVPVRWTKSKIFERKVARVSQKIEVILDSNGFKTVNVQGLFPKQEVFLHTWVLFAPWLVYVVYSFSKRGGMYLQKTLRS
jgi:hypothetical protein